MAQSTTARPEILRVDHLTKSFGRVVALDDVSCGVRSGEVLGLIGPNGAGKTTLFECLAGLLPVDRGVVSFDGHPLTVAERGQHFFYVPDGIAPWPAETVGWALEYTIGFFGGAADARAEIIRQLDLAPLVDLRIGTLSKGQRKRVTLAIALLTPQPLLLIDEPFDGLDLRQSRELARNLRIWADAGRTLFLSIHQIADAALVCDRFALLSAGRVCGEGTLADLTSSQAPGADPARALEEAFLALT